jgi:hypothetical protein
MNATNIIIYLYKQFSKVLFPCENQGVTKIPAELPRLSHEEGSRQAGRPSCPQSLTTLSTRLRPATTLRMGALQVESPKYGVCSDFH